MAKLCTSIPLTACIAVLIALAIGCSDTPGPESVYGPEAGSDLSPLGKYGKHGQLDSELHSLLVAASEGRGIAYFRFPDGNLSRIPQDPKNPLTRAKITLGRLLYHETAVGVNNVRPEGYETYACASCHHAQGGFQANLPQGISEGGMGFGHRGEGRTFMPGYDSSSEWPDCQPIRTPTALNSAYQELMLWNGQFGGVGDNLGTEAQWTPGTPKESNHLGLHGLETQVHAGMGVHRMLDIEQSRIPTLRRYQVLFRRAFPGEVDPINRLNFSLAVATYERTLLADRAPFQRYLNGNRRAMTDQQKRGAILFFSKAACVDCHTGPALNSMTFYALGMKDLDGAWNMARVNLQPFGGTIPDDVRRGRGGFTGRPEDMYTFKTPQLYNLLDSPFLGHGSSFASVREIIEYKNAAVPENPLVPAGQLAAAFTPLGLTPGEITDVTAFVEGALYDTQLMRYVPKSLPSGNCFPVNDPQGRSDLGCNPDEAGSYGDVSSSSHESSSPGRERKLTGE